MGLVGDLGLDFCVDFDFESDLGSELEVVRFVR